ncbi:MAG: tRNA pseudouridine(55) synthase TruB [Lachnospiraceae bacterium]|nr:tRNA pseudouridine(55) synthase TruB [Lachnospiraceae bacterium]
MYHGIINIYKESGYTSFDVVAKLRGILHQKKIGHTGTLDPDAEGVLPVCLGNGTKLVEDLTEKTKVYECIMKLGVETDTEDMSGKVLSTGAVTCSEEEIKTACLSFIGDYDQIPPMYSAIKVDGRKLYELARSGVEIERKARPVRIIGLEVNKILGDEVTMTVTCSRGTYIRSLCRDIGKKLGCGAAMAHLLRVRSGEFGLEGSMKLSEVEALAAAGKAEDAIIPVEYFYSAYPSVHVKPEAKKLIDNGNPLDNCDLEEGEGLKAPYPEKIRVFNVEGKFAGVYSYDPVKRKFMPDKMFMAD